MFQPLPRSLWASTMGEIHLKKKEEAKRERRGPARGDKANWDRERGDVKEEEDKKAKEVGKGLRLCKKKVGEEEQSGDTIDMNRIAVASICCRQISVDF